MCHLVRREVLDNGYCLVRPPGHHAHSDVGGGFCIFNSVAIAAKKYADLGLKVLVVDWDVHHANGTQSILEDSNRVLVLSLH